MQVGSVADNGSGGSYAYRASKSALNNGMPPAKAPDNGCFPQLVSCAVACILQQMWSVALKQAAWRVMLLGMLTTSWS